MSRSEKDKKLPIIRKMPIIQQKVLDALRVEMDQGGDNYYWGLGAKIAEGNPQHREAYEKSKQEKPPETPDATKGIVLLVWRALEMQAENDGYRLPEVPSPISPLPALRKFIPQAKGSAVELIDIAYNELLKTNPLIENIVQDIVTGAPDQFLQVITEAQAKRGAVFAFYGVKAAIPKKGSRN